MSIADIILYLAKERGVDFSVYRPGILERRIGNRITALKCDNPREYLVCLKNDPEEPDNLIDVLTINISRFFRNSLTFEYLADKIIPTLALEKCRGKNPVMRIWSAGCSTGEEPYSVAILFRELMSKERAVPEPSIFATDLDNKALIAAGKGAYSFESIKDVKYGFLKKYFSVCNDSFIINDEIKKMVNFSKYDLFDKKRYAPPESIFGSFDMIFCRNVLIYFRRENQEIIFNKFYRALGAGGCLVLGKAESLLDSCRRYFSMGSSALPIYMKQEVPRGQEVRF